MLFFGFSRPMFTIQCLNMSTQTRNRLDFTRACATEIYSESYIGRCLARESDLIVTTRQLIGTHREIGFNVVVAHQFFKRIKMSKPVTKKSTT